MKIVFFTGAGISVAAGLPTYRGPDGKYTPGSSNFVPPVIVDHSLSVADFAAANDSIRSLRPQLKNTYPTQAHMLIAKLETNHNVTVITQNIDNLHRAAKDILITANCKGIDKSVDNIIELHGNVFHERYDENWEMDRVDVVFFGEQLDPNKIDAAYTAIDEYDLFISVGTSGSVYPAAHMMETAFERRWAKPSRYVAIHIDPQLPEIYLHGAEHLAMSADDGLSKLCDRLIP